MDWLLPLVVGGSCAVCAAIPAWLWSRAVTKLDQMRAERDRERDEKVQAYRTIQSLNRQLGNTETQFIPLSVSQRWMKGE